MKVLKQLVLAVYNWIFPISSNRRRKLYNLILYRLFPDESDKILLDFFKQSDGVSFMVIGANDGIHMDKIHKFLKRFKSAGILVEPMPEAFSRLKRNYSKLEKGTFHFENSAVSSIPEQKYFYYLDGPSKKKVDVYSSFNKEHVEKFMNETKGYNVAKRLVNCTTIEELISKYNINPELLLIDAEGYDFEIIKSINFATYKPQILIYESINLSETDQESCIQVLSDQGYQLLQEGMDCTAVLSMEYSSRSDDTAI